MDDVSLENFFSRPIKIRSYSWGTGTNLFETFNPWTDFWENPRNLARITNYNLLRCKLHVKFLLNGNGFHYGRAIASYIPLHNADTFTKDRTFFIEDVVAASQRPHVYLDPTKSLGGELVLPFVYPFNAMDVPDEAWDDMGDIIIHGMQNLKHANGASDSVTVSVFAWATDVVISTPTANEPPTFTAQFGEYVPQADEYSKTAISAPAAALARAAGALTSVPIIGAYAKATQMAASTVASIARIFGYSRPAVLDSIVPFRPIYMGNMVNSLMPDSTTKLTLDPKQELTIDTRTFGLSGVDEMTISSIASRESFLTNFGWLVADTTESLLWNTEVNPVIWNQVTNGTNEEYHMPACCFAALPFTHWKGTMKFRFQIVASAFHKGRLKITYDPSYAATNEYNTNYTRIIDLAEERDFTVEIGWGQGESFLRHRDVVSSIAPIYNTTAITADPGQLSNGILSVYVVNELTVPNSTANNDIQINVFVSAGEDLELANPTDFYLRDLSWFEPQFGEYVPQSGELSTPDSDNTNMESAPMKLTPDESIAAPLSSSDASACVYFGDPVVSIRQLLKRYTFARMHVPPEDATGNRVVTWTIGDFPLYYGYAPGAVDIDVGAVPFNYVQNTMLNYFTPAYTCRRGSIRWKYMAIKQSSAAADFMAVSREPVGAAVYSVTSDALLNETASDSARVASWRAILGRNYFTGCVVTPQDRNPALEVEFPFYSNRRFLYAKQANQSTLNIGTDTIMHVLQVKNNLSANSTYGVASFASVGEDFTLGFFTGAPVAYQQLQPATL